MCHHRPQSLDPNAVVIGNESLAAAEFAVQSVCEVLVVSALQHGNGLEDVLDPDRFSRANR
jgi:hypothetical protein